MCLQISEVASQRPLWNTPVRNQVDPTKCEDAVDDWTPYVAGATRIGKCAGDGASTSRNRVDTFTPTHAKGVAALKFVIASSGRLVQGPQRKDLCTAFANWRNSPIVLSANQLSFSNLRLALRLPLEKCVTAG
jgi:hypothetical protein